MRLTTNRVDGAEKAEVYHGYTAYESGVVHEHVSGKVYLVPVVVEDRDQRYPYPDVVGLVYMDEYTWRLAVLEAIEYDSDANEETET